MDIIYVIAFLLFIILIYILIISVRNLVRLKKELRKMTELNKDSDMTRTKS